jgi:sporulation protein YlmC with PRC-barrel domain
MANATVHPNHALISSEDVEGADVYDPKGNKVGDIDHLMIDKMSGRVSYAVMSFGGFLGLGHSHYPVPWATLKYDTSLDGYVTGITEAQLRDAPEFSDDSWGAEPGKRSCISTMAQPPIGSEMPCRRNPKRNRRRPAQRSPPNAASSRSQSSSAHQRRCTAR